MVNGGLNYKDLKVAKFLSADLGNRLYGWILSNYGNPLKLMVPSHNGNVMCGWSNYSDLLYYIIIINMIYIVFTNNICKGVSPLLSIFNVDKKYNNNIAKVTSHEINESAMGNRVAKSDSNYLEYNFSQSLFSLFVKVQRVYGSTCIGLSFILSLGFIYILYNNACIECWIQVRYTLMVQETGYPVKILSNLLISGVMLTAPHEVIKLDPKFITGLTDAEGSFSIKISKIGLRWRTQLDFCMGMHIRDKDLLIAVQEFFGVGKIHENKSSVYYSVRSINDLATVISHFEKYPLQTSKAADFILFRRAMHIMQNKSHLIPEGLREIVSLKGSMNWGISNVLATAFPDTLPVERPAIILSDINPQWLAGFTTGEGCFYVIVGESNSTKTGFRVRLRFNLTQHVKDLVLINKIQNYFGCGSIYINREAASYNVYSTKVNINIIAAFFAKYPVAGYKNVQYLQWMKVVEIIQSNTHNTVIGIEMLKQLKQK